jgi:hypothetical protein
VNEQRVDTGNLGEVHSEDAIVLGAKIVCTRRSKNRPRDAALAA